MESNLQDPYNINLTLAELEELITAADLPIGQKYYVTDKDWLLYANTASIVKSVSGSLHIFNGETLPIGVEPDVLLIDTGIVTDDIILNGLAITVPADYNPISFMIKNLDSSTELNPCTLSSAGGNVLHIGNGLFETQIGYSSNASYVNSIDGITFMPPYTLIVNGNAGSGFRSIIEFHRSELSVPIPVPHIVSAELNSVDTIDIVFDSDIAIKTIYTTDQLGFMVYRNGIAEGDNFWVFVSNETKNAIIMIESADQFAFNDVVTFSINSSNEIKNTWGGLLADVVDYPVVNNIPQD